MGRKGEITSGWAELHSLVESDTIPENTVLINEACDYDELGIVFTLEREASLLLAPIFTIKYILTLLLLSSQDGGRIAMSMPRDRDATMFHKDRRVVVKHVLYGVLLTALLAGLFWYRAVVALELAPALARVPGVTRDLATTILTWLVVILLVVAGPFFVAATVFLVYRLVNPVPALVVDDEGFTDRVSLTNLGRVQWSDVRSISLVKQMGIPQLRLTFTTEASVFAEIGGLKGAYLQFNQRVMPGDAAIPVHQLDADSTEVVAAFEKRSPMSVEK